MRRWGHPHSVASGALFGLLAAGHPWWTVPLAFLVGLLIGRFWSRVRRDALAVIARAAALHDAKVETQREKTRTERARGDSVRATAAAAATRLRSAVELAYRQGAEDVLKEQAARR